MDHPNGRSLGIEDLRWLRRLAQRLVSDPHLADDAVGDTLVTALSRAPRRPGSLRNWLAVVLRNSVRQQARGRSRRAARDAQVPPVGTAPSTLEIAAELSVQRRLVECVNALDEPYRATIVLRFLHERSARDIAREQGVPVKSVHTRIERGLALLRRKLDHEFDGRRSAWAAVLMPLIRSKPAWIGTTVGMVIPMNLKWIVPCAGLFALGTLIWLPTWLQPDGLRGVAPAVGAPRSTELLTPERPLAPPAAESAPRLRAAVPQDPPQAPPAAVPAAPPQIEGWVRTLSGQAVGDVDVVFERGGDAGFARSASAPRVHTRPDGSFAMPLPEQSGRLSVDSDRYASVALPFLDGTPPAEPPIVVVAPSRRYAGRVLDGAGNPIESARVEVSLDGSFLQSSFVHTSGMDGRTVHLLLPFAETRTDAGGAFALDHVGYVAGAHVEALRDGWRPARVQLPELSRGDIELTLEPVRAERALFGLVVEPDGTPLADARVSFGFHTARTDPSGRFSLELRSWQSSGTLMAVEPGRLPASLAFEWSPDGEGSDPEHPLVLALGPEPLSIEGRVLDADGDPRPGVVVSTPQSTLFGEVLFEVGGKSIRGFTTVESLLAGGAPAPPWEASIRATTDEHGRFALTGLMQREYAVMALDPITLVGVPPTVVRAGETVVLTLEDVDLQSVAGRVVSRAGTPLAGVQVALGRGFDWKRPAEAARGPLAPPGAVMSFPDQGARTTDASGRFGFEAVQVEGAFLSLRGSAIVLGASHPLDRSQALEQLEIVVDAACRFRVVLEGDPTLADGFRMLDAEDRPQPLYVEIETRTISTSTVEIQDGRSGVAMTHEGERVLVLTKDGREVQRRTVAFEPGSLQEIRL
jgi:RNA polymerase sigma-70 factor (ECF subfamily)